METHRGTRLPGVSALSPARGTVGAEGPAPGLGHLTAFQAARLAMKLFASPSGVLESRRKGAVWRARGALWRTS